MADDPRIKDILPAVYKTRAEKTIAAFTRKRLKAEYVPDRNAAVIRILELIPASASIGRGDSMTLDQIGIMPILSQQGTHEIFNPYLTDEQGHFLVKGDERLTLQKKALLADVFLSGANAITLDGKVVCTDGHGNRVAALIFGPKKVIIVAGVNKIVDNLDLAFKRIHEIAVPGNTRRHVVLHNAPATGLETPCVKTGVCKDCAHVARSCCYTVIIEAGKEADYASQGVGSYPRETVERINIILVGENLGL